MSDKFIKLVSVVYGVLDFFPEGDPLKNKAKEKALAVLDGLTLFAKKDGDWSSLKDYLSAEKVQGIKNLLRDIEILESYLKLARQQEWISQMNLLIIFKEFNEFKLAFNYIKGKKEFVAENKEIDGLSKTKNILENKKESQKLISDKKSEKVVKKSYTDSLIKSDLEPKNLSGRQEKILNILNSKEKAQVADIIKELPDVTKRTIRRDLDDLLKKSKITREGQFNQVVYKIR